MPKIEQTGSAELKQLQHFAHIGKRFKNNDLEHLDGAMGAYNYIRMANIMVRHMGNSHVKEPLKNDVMRGNEELPPESYYPVRRQGNSEVDEAGRVFQRFLKFLDWGAGYGQITWLLRNRGIDAVGYNVEEREHVVEIPELAELDVFFDKDPVKIPFENASFAGVSSCGVLEHVADPVGSLKEINRILLPGGYFFLFMLPQKTSWVEKLSEWRGISVHPVRYTVQDTKKMLVQAGFEIEKLWRFNLIPKNLTGLPKSLKRFYGRFYKILYPLDRMLSKLPVVNLLSGVIECVARKKS